MIVTIYNDGKIEHQLLRITRVSGEKCEEIAMMGAGHENGYDMIDGCPHNQSFDLAHGDQLTIEVVGKDGAKLCKSCGQPVPDPEEDDDSEEDE